MRFLAILLLSVAAAVTYGIVHDQITAHLCVEYFTVGHPILVPTEDPMVLGLVWGVVATWWVGVLVGATLAVASGWGRWPKLNAKDLIRPIVTLMLCVGVFAALAGVAGYVAAINKLVWIPSPLSEQIPAERRIWFLVDLWTHSASYLGGFLGGLALCGWAMSRRRSLAGQQLPVVQP